MSVKELEQRVAVLEREVQRLKDELAATQPGRAKDWLSSVEKFAGNEDLLSVFADALRLREQDRKRTRPKRAAERKSKT